VRIDRGGMVNILYLVDMSWMIHSLCDSRDLRWSKMKCQTIDRARVEIGVHLIGKWRNTMLFTVEMLTKHT
jgi:hypothetical protein